MKKILNSILIILGLGLTLFITTFTLNPHKEFFQNQDAYVFSQGNATLEIRNQIELKLHLFQKGYEARDTAAIDQFMNELFSRENIVIL